MGSISGEPKNINVGESGAEKAVVFGNLVILEYDPDKSNAIVDVEAAGEVKLDGNVDEKAVDAFYSVAGY